MTTAPPAAERLERIVGIVLRVGVTASSLCLAAGLIASFSNGPPPLARMLLQVGVLVLLATPVARVIVSIVTVGIYAFWWTYNMMNEPNRHFEVNWAWEDSLAQAAQALQQ